MQSPQELVEEVIGILNARAQAEKDESEKRMLEDMLRE